MEKFLHHKEKTSAEVITLSAGEKIPLHNHPGREEEYECISGYGTVTVNGIEYPFSQGDRVLISKGSKHEVINTGDEPLLFYAINISAPEQDDTTFWNE